MRNGDLLKWWMVVGGALQVLMGVLGVVDTSVVGRAPDALLTMNATHAGVHALGGVLAIGIGLLLRGDRRADAALAYGFLFVLGFALNLASPDLGGRMDAPANTAVHVMHATIAIVTLATGFVAHSKRGQTTLMPNG